MAFVSVLCSKNDHGIKSLNDQSTCVSELKSNEISCISHTEHHILTVSASLQSYIMYENRILITFGLILLHFKCFYWK